MNTIQTYSFKTFIEESGWLEIDLESFVMEKLKNYIEAAKQTPVSLNEQLAGNISKSLRLEDKNNWFWQNVLIEVIGRFNEHYPEHINDYAVLSENAPYFLHSFWVNFQKQHEFNPSHTHEGIWSFVIWVKIPTDWKEQHALPISANSNTPCASSFHFLHSSMMGQVKNTWYHLDKESEGKMLFFPAKLNHQVMPFYNCDEERISISGNIRIDTSENSMRQYRNGVQMLKKENIKFPSN